MQFLGQWKYDVKVKINICIFNSNLWIQYADIYLLKDNKNLNGWKTNRRITKINIF